MKKILTDIMPRRGDMTAATLAGFLGLPILFLIAHFNFRVSHDMAETFSFVVAFGIFMMVWNARSFLDNHYYLFLGIAYLFVGAIDFVHTLSFEGLFPDGGPNLHAQLWYLGRFLQSAALLVAPAFADRKLRPAPCIAAFAAVAAFSLACILAWGIFPDFLMNGTQPTRFRSVSAAAVATAQGAAIALLLRKRELFDGAVCRLLVGSILFSIGTEFAGGLYSDAIVYNNLLGHYLKIVSFYLAYKAVIATGLRRPYDLLFLNLKKSEEELRAARDGLESRVAERTAELLEANTMLERELLQRHRADEMRELMLALHQLTNSINGVREFLSSLLRFLKERFGFEAIGIRYRRGDDYPYFKTLGFPQEFVQAEMSLCPDYRSACAEDGAGGGRPLECLCGAVIAGTCEPSLPFFTPNGTFWTNAASELISSSDAARAIAARGRCVRQGYESIALVPLRFGDATFGLLQFNDRSKGMFDTHLLAQLERVAENIGDTLARLLTREALQESEDRFRSLVENSPVGILIVQDGRIVFRNPEPEHLFGPIPEGVPFRELGEVHPDDRQPFETLCLAMTAGEGYHSADIRFFTKASESEGRPMKWVHIRTSRIEYLGRMATLVNMVDITRVKDLEQIAANRERLASLGQLAAGIAHEIRNPLSGIYVNVSALEHLCRRFDALGSEEEAKIGATVGKIRLASAKIASVVRRVMDFSKPVPPRLGQADMNVLIEEAVHLSEASLRRSGIELRKDLAPDLPKCRADSRLLEQVFLNVITNAIEAMENADGQRLLELTSALEGGRLVARVADSGPGIPPHLRSKVFDPFYTTRKDGHGIGLSFSHRVVADHGGAMTVSASRWGGAEFRIEIPLEKSAV